MKFQESEGQLGSPLEQSSARSPASADYEVGICLVIEVSFLRPLNRFVTFEVSRNGCSNAFYCHMERTASDFRYYMHDGATAFRFELAGRLSDDAAGHLQQAWRTASSIVGERSLIVDLSYVSAIDTRGQDLLRDWHNQGAKLVANSAEARALLRSITGQYVPIPAASTRHSTWLPFRVAAYTAIAIAFLTFPGTISAV